MNSLKILLPFFLSLNCHVVDDGVLREILLRFMHYTQANPIEKIYIQTDKIFYISGEKIPFKVFTLFEPNNSTATIESKIVVDLVSQEKEIIRRFFLNRHDKTLNGFFQIDRCPEGYYFLLAHDDIFRDSCNLSNIKQIYIANQLENNFGDIFLLKKNQKERPDSLIVQLLNQNYNTTERSNLEIQFLNNDQLIASITLKNVEQRVGIPLMPIAPDVWDKTRIRLKYRNQIKYFSLPSVSARFDVQFFPEGGQLINGEPCKVAVKAKDANGQGISINGILTDKLARTITDFHTDRSGLGLFSFTPSNTEYTATVSDADNNEQNFKILPPNPFASQLSVIGQDSINIEVKVLLGDSIYGKGKATFIVGTNRGKICFASSGKEMYTAKIPKADFKNGIANLTLFNDLGVPVSERLIFIADATVKEKIGIYIQPELKNDSTRVEISIKDKLGDFLPGNYSIAVADTTAMASMTWSDNIQSSMLLASDLSTSLFQPGFPLDLNDPKSNLMLESILLTSQWSSFKWNNILSDAEQNKVYTLEDGFKISGQIIPNSKRSIAATTVTLFGDRFGQDPDETTWSAGFATDTIDPKEKFEFKKLHFYDKTQFIIQARNQRGNTTDVQIQLDSSSWRSQINPVKFPEHLITNQLIAYFKEANKQAIIDQLQKNTSLPPVLVKGYSKKDKGFDQSRRVSNSSIIVPSAVIEKVGNVNLANVLLTVPGITLTDNKITIHGPGSLKKDDIEPLVIVDGVAIDDPLPDPFGGGKVAAVLNGISAYMIDFIEILKSSDAAAYGVRGANGVILINTKKGETSSFKTPESGTIKFYPRGYDRQDDSSYYQLAQSRIDKNIRNTSILWLPKLQHNEGNKIVVMLPSIVKNGRYKLTIEGITDQGDIVSKSINIH